MDHLEKPNLLNENPSARVQDSPFEFLARMIPDSPNNAGSCHCFLFPTRTRWQDLMYKDTMHFWGWGGGSRHVFFFSMYPWLSWNSLYRLDWPLNSHRSTCACLQRSWIKGEHKHCLAKTPYTLNREKLIELEV